MKKIYQIISFSIIACFLIFSCSEYEPSESDDSKAGSICFNVEWIGAPTFADELGATYRALDCAASNIATVTFYIIDINDNQLATESWPCTLGEGIVDGVPAGTDRKLIVEGTDDQERVLYRGTVEGITVVAGEHEDVQTVTCYPVEVINAAYLQYRTLGNGTSEYRGWIDFTKNGNPIEMSAITQIALKNSSGNSIYISGTEFFSETHFNGEWNASTLSVDYSGSSYYTGFSIRFPAETSLPAGYYTYEATTSQGDILSTQLYFPGETVMPTVDDASMNFEWRINNNLYLSWDSPTGEFDQLRIIILDQDYHDLLYLKLPPDAVEVTVPDDIIQNISDLKDPTEVNWNIQTLSYTPTEDNNNYARGYSNYINLAWQPIPNSVLIPSGCFDMGDAFNEGDSVELPVHTVCITSDFYMDVHEVTNAEYAACVSAGGCTAPSSSSSYTRTSYYGDQAYDDFPVIYVSWNQANDYCTWAGKRLPTEAEWEYAARGGLSGKRYPWGDTISGTDANYHDSGDTWDNDTSPVGNYTANGYGLYDMAGNVSEWVNDWYQMDYYSESQTNDPSGPVSGTDRVLRGGSWLYSTFFLRVASRSYTAQSYQFDFIGFRCAGD